MIPQQYHLFLGIGVLVFLMLFISAMAQKYQAYQLEKQAALRRMLWAIQQIESALEKLVGCSVPARLMVLLRKEILARYMAMRQIHPGVGQIDLYIETARQKLETAEASTTPPRIDLFERAQLDQYVNGLTELIGYLNSQNRIAGMEAAEKVQFLTELGNLRADYVSQYYQTHALEMAKKGLWDEATVAVKSIMRYFETHGPVNDHVKELYQAANESYKQISLKQIPGEDSAAGNESGQEQQPESVGETESGVT